MKKGYLVLVSVFLALFFTSCNNYHIDEYGCFVSLEEAKQEAAKKNLPVLAIITQEEGEAGGGSMFFLKNILSTSSFRKSAKNKFVLYRMDCSQKTFQKSAIVEEGSAKEKEQSLFYSDAISQGFELIASLAVEYTPFFAFLLPQGYIVNEIEYDEEKMDVQKFGAILDYYYEEAKMSAHLVDLIENAQTDSEKFTSIESLYETTPVKFHSSLINLARLAVKLDPENKTGKIGKYVYDIADSDASELCVLKQDYEGAIKIYLDAADNSWLSNDEKIQCYYMAAYIIERYLSIDDPRIIEYMNKALELNPQDELRAYLENGIEYFQNTVKSVTE